MRNLWNRVHIEQLHDCALSDEQTACNRIDLKRAIGTLQEVLRKVSHLKHGERKAMLPRFSEIDIYLRRMCLDQLGKFFLPQEREWFQQLILLGMYDGFRLCHPDEDQLFSWFDYRSRGFEREPRRGLRIDHLLVSELLRERVVGAGIDYDIRAMEKPSDHAPAWIELGTP